MNVPQEPRTPGQDPVQEATAEGVRTDRIVNLCIAGGLMLMCMGACVYFAIDASITPMMALVALALPCLIITVISWSSYDSAKHSSRAVRGFLGTGTMHPGRLMGSGLTGANRGIPGHNMAGTFVMSVLIDVPVKVLDVLMSEDALELTIFTFVIPCAALLTLFLFVPHPDSYPGPIRFVLFDLLDHVRANTTTRGF